MEKKLALKIFIALSYLTSTQAGRATYIYNPEFKVKETTDYKIRYSTIDQLYIEEGTLTSEVAAQESSKTTLKYRYQPKSLTINGTLITEPSYTSKPERIVLTSNGQIESLVLNTMLPFYMHVSLAQIPSEIPNIGESWDDSMINNHFIFEAKPRLNNQTPRRIKICYKHIEVTNLNKSNYLHKIAWNAIGETMSGLFGKWGETNSRRKGMIIVDTKGKIEYLHYQLPNAIPGFPLTNYLTKNEQDVILQIRSTENQTATDSEDDAQANGQKKKLRSTIQVQNLRKKGRSHSNASTNSKSDTDDQNTQPTSKSLDTNDPNKTEDD